MAPMKMLSKSYRVCASYFSHIAGFCTFCRRLTVTRYIPETCIKNNARPMFTYFQKRHFAGLTRKIRIRLRPGLAGTNLLGASSNPKYMQNYSSNHSKDHDSKISKNNEKSKLGEKQNSTPESKADEKSMKSEIPFVGLSRRHGLGLSRRSLSPAARLGMLLSDTDWQIKDPLGEMEKIKDAPDSYIHDKTSFQKSETDPRRMSMTDYLYSKKKGAWGPSPKVRLLNDIKSHSISSRFCKRNVILNKGNQ